MKEKIKEIEKLHCEICKKDIPHSVVLSFEGADYIRHFCSTECHDYYFECNPQDKPCED